jgi:hypothetical protein
MERQQQMNPIPDYTKRCSRCGLPVRLTREQYELERGQEETTCERCRAILTAEAEEIFKQFPKDEAQEPQAPATPANPT